jgi:hypothetical protein
MTSNNRLVWRRQDIVLRRAPFVLDDDMKQRAGQTLSMAAGRAGRSTVRE